MMFEFLTKELILMIANVAVVLGIPFAIIQFYLRKKSEDRRNDGLTFDALARDYEAWVKFCLENLDLDVADWPRNESQKSIPAKPHKEQREYLAFCILNAMFERAYLMYRDRNAKIRKQQWQSGWEKSIAYYAGCENFKQFWNTGGGYNWDEGFIEYMRNTHKIGPGVDRKKWWISRIRFCH
jgi:hypothetical protein